MTICGENFVIFCFFVSQGSAATCL